MSLTKDSFNQAKKKANKRLSQWVADVKPDRECGIQRLRAEFKDSFKVMERKQVKADLNQRNEAHKIKNDMQLLKNVSEESLCRKNRHSAVLPTLQLSEQHIRDSNSSNVSSRLGGDRDEIRYSDQRTPFVKTQFPQDHIEALEALDGFDELKHVNNSVTNPPAQPERKSRTKHFPIELEDTLLEFNKRRKRKKAKEAKRVALNTETQKSGPVFSEADGVPLAMLSSVRQRLRLKKPEASKIDIVVPKIIEQTCEEDRRKWVIDRFRRLVRKLIHVRVLLNSSMVRMKEKEKSKEFKRYDHGNELSFDVGLYKKSVSYGGLSNRARRSLSKSTNERTEEDDKVLMDIMQRLPIFDKYPNTVKKALAHLLWYDCFTAGRVIVKQGDPGSRMYFVVSGEVELKRTDILESGVERSYHIKTVLAGSTFGELALIRDMRRELSAVCSGTSEFLSLSKDEFNQALRWRWEKVCHLRFSFLRSSDYFSNWNDEQLQKCAESSELKDYSDSSIILGDTDGISDSVYFVYKGHCDIVRRLTVVRHQSPYQRPSILLPNAARKRSEFLNKTYCKSRRSQKEETHFLTVTTLNPGDFFGAGENLHNTFILSRGKTECVLINSAEFSIHGQSEQLRAMTLEREEAQPSNKSLYRRFQINRKWYEYRNRLVQEVLNRKSMIKCTSRANVPRCILNEPTIPKDLIYYSKINRKC